MKTINFWKAYNISNQKNNVYICSDSDMAAILDFVQNGRHERGFCEYLSKIFLESMKTIHIWKAYNIRIRKSNVHICSDSNMAAILHFVQNDHHETGFRKYHSKIFLETMKTIHIWKAYNISNQKKNNVYISTESNTAAILHLFTKWPP